MVRKILIHEPIHDALTPSLTIIVTRISEVKHQKNLNSNVLMAAKATRTPQCIAHINDATNRSFSFPVMSLVINLVWIYP